MNEEGDEPVRWMACVYAKELIELSSGLLLEETHPKSRHERAEWFVSEMERALNNIKFNLKDKPKKPLTKPTETTPSR